MAFNIEKLRTPQFIFIVYVFTVSLLIMIFRFIFPGSQPPLLIYSFSWRIIQGVLEVFNLFPALALSALVIPFGLAPSEENYQSFSDMFFKRLMSSIVTAVGAAVVYGIIFFLAFPLVKNYEENLRFSGDLYHLAKRSAQEYKEAGEWHQASEFLAVCDRIWFNSPELADLKDTIAINLQERFFDRIEERDLARTALSRDRRSDEIILLSENVNQEEIDAVQAIAMSRTAFNNNLFFDAHWLAVLGTRLAPDGSAQQASAAQLASEAWNMISLQSPNRREERLVELHNIKLSGYQAMNAERWINAYYIFQELILLTPDDPDVVRFLAASERGANKTAFFIDEMNLSLGEIIYGPLYSLPSGMGRAVLRFSSLTATADEAFGVGFEYMRFDANNNLQANVISKYAKLLPIIINEKPQVLVLTHALDRYDENNSFTSEWLLGNETPGGIILDISFEDFLIISHVRRGLSNLQLDELFAASNNLHNTGYVPEIFQAEILYRLGSALFFLPMAIFVIIIAWRYRAKGKPRYFFLLMLPVLPVVFHGFVFLYRSVFNTMGIWLILSVGFIPALIIFIFTLAVSLFISLIALAAQHS